MKKKNQPKPSHKRAYILKVINFLLHWSVNWLLLLFLSINHVKIMTICCFKNILSSVVRHTCHEPASKRQNTDHKQKHAFSQISQIIEIIENNGNYHFSSNGIWMHTMSGRTEPFQWFEFERRHKNKNKYFNTNKKIDSITKSIYH